MANQDFVGIWRLVSAETRRSDGKVRYLLGEKAVGLLTYTADGYMFGNLHDPDRPNFAENNFRKGTSEEIKAAFEGCIAYCGKYEVKREEGAVYHYVESSWFPNWVGQVQQRFFKLEDNRLTLSPPPLHLNGFEYVDVLVWEKI